MDKKIKYRFIAVYDEIIFNSKRKLVGKNESGKNEYINNITDKCFCLYGYLKTLGNNISLTKDTISSVKKILKYRTVESLKKDLNLLERLGYVKIKDGRLSFTYLNKKWTALPFNIFREVMTEINNHKAIRYLYYLQSHYNKEKSKAENKSNIYPEIRKSAEILASNNVSTISKLNDLLEQYGLVEIGVIKKKYFCNNYEVQVKRIVNFSTDKKVDVKNKKERRKEKRRE